MSDPDVKVPDVSNKTVVKAEEILEDKGFEVATKTKEVYDDKIKEGRVVKTDPTAGRSVKKGTEITLIVSKGTNKFEIEDYTGQNVYEVKAKLENEGINVLIETKEVTDESNYQENLIISQSVEEGEKLKEGDSITLVIPDFVTTYPDFVSEGWSVDNIKNFCNQNSVTLNINYQETSNYPEGTVISQSRVSGTKVVANTPLTITVAKAPAKQETPPTDDNEKEPTDPTDEEDTPTQGQTE